MAFSPMKQRVLELLRTSKNITSYLYDGGFIDVEMFKSIEKLEFDFIDVVDERFIASIVGKDGKRYIRATFGHKSPILERMNYGKYVKYNGRYNVFCITHTSLDGLGAVNTNRTLNILNIPERCENKGVKGYINIENARKDGFEFWSPVSDRYQNKIFCFDIDLRSSVYKFEYVPNYASEELLVKTHASVITAIQNFGVSNQEALKRVKDLIIIEENSEEDIDMEELRIN
jgi:hypothetical protein